MWTSSAERLCSSLSFLICLRFFISLGSHFAAMLGIFRLKPPPVQISIWLCCKRSPGQYAGLKNVTMSTCKSFLAHMSMPTAWKFKDHELLMCFPKTNINIPASQAYLCEHFQYIYFMTGSHSSKTTRVGSPPSPVLQPLWTGGAPVTSRGVGASAFRQLEQLVWFYTLNPACLHT